MKFGVNTFVWMAGVDDDLLKLLPSIKERGFVGVEMPLISPDQVPVAKIRRSCLQHACLQGFPDSRGFHAAIPQ